MTVVFSRGATPDTRALLLPCLVVPVILDEPCLSHCGDASVSSLLSGLLAPALQPVRYIFDHNVYKTYLARWVLQKSASPSPSLVGVVFVFVLVFAC